MKKLVLFMVIALSSFTVHRMVEQRGVAADTRPRPRTPMTIVEAELLDSDVESHRMVAVRSDGAKTTRALKTGKSNTGSEARTIILPAEGKEMVIADAVKALSTFYSPVSTEVIEKARTVTLDARCADESAPERRLLGEETVLGYQTYKYQGKQSVAGFVQDETVWLAPVLDCYAIHFVNRRVNSAGDVVSTFERRALSITVGEPDAALFAAPTGYREIPPSQASQELRALRTGRRFGEGASDSKLLPGMSRMDQKYFDSQRYRP